MPRLQAIPERLVITTVLLGITAALVLSNWLWRWDRLFYDTVLRLQFREPAQNIVIVAIDDASLSELGQWPWPRGHHAALIELLNADGARAIAFDLLFAEPSERDPEGDKWLMDAAQAGGNVVLPVAIDEVTQGRQLREVLPFPGLAERAAGLGHVNVDLEMDGVARGVYLRDGLGSAVWPHLGATTLVVAGMRAAYETLPGARNPGAPTAPPQVVVRDNYVLIPFAGPPGHFPRLSYHDVLAGRYPPDTFRDRIVLVGATAIGMGDALPTPVSGLSLPMPGVEINANVIDALAKGLTITPLTRLWQLLLSLGIVAVLLLLYPLLRPRAVLVATALLLAGLVVLDAGAMLAAHVFFPPTPALLGITLSYVLWAWRRLERTVAYLDQELRRLHGEPLTVAPSRDVESRHQRVAFLRRLLPVQGWVVLQEGSNEVTASGGRPPSGPPELTSDTSWRRNGDGLWLRVTRGNEAWNAGVTWTSDEPPTVHEMRLLDDLVHHLVAPYQPPPGSRAVTLETRIEQVQGAIERLRGIRRFVSETLEQMLDGVVVASAGGHIVMANRQGCEMLMETPVSILEADIFAVLERLEGAPRPWDQLVREVLIDRKSVTFEARSADGRDVLVMASPLSVWAGFSSAMIINLADIHDLKEAERKRVEALSFLSHDLRSPMVSLLSLVQLQRRESNRLTEAEILDRVESDVGKVMSLCEDFIQLAQAESVRRDAFDDVDMSSVMHEAIDQIYAFARARDVHIERDLSATEAWVEGDVALLERAVGNLLSNAIKYSPANSTVKVTVSLDVANVRCVVADQGYGIPADELPRIFERYHRVHNKEGIRERGIGLGLAFVKVVAEKHRGRIEVSSVEGVGSTFVLTLPALDAGAVDRPGREEGPPAPPQTAQGSLS